MPPPSRKSYRNHKGGRTHCRHTDEYWDKLRRDFSTCTYNNGGAYQLTETRVRGESIDNIRRDIALVESNMRPRPGSTHRLSRAINHPIPKKTLD